MAERVSRRDFCLQLVKAGASVLVPPLLSPGLLKPKEISIQNQPVYYRLPSEKYQPDEIALTLDDCFRPDKLSVILDIIEKEKVPLTIFPAGRVFKALPVKIEDKSYSFKEQLIRAAELGCFFGNHTLHHQNLNKLGVDDVKEEVICGYDVLWENLPRSCGKQILPVFRPPGGYFNDSVKEAIKDNPFVKAIVLWNCDSEGGRYPSDGREEEKMKESLIKQIKHSKNRIILLHTISNDVRIFPWLVDYLRNSSFRLTDLSRLA
ncbi:MAG: Peptidoglycan-N-acetylglucosamine deacetylase [Microgenomates group bacterium ADurb.Bin219]|nr:MAG: Peptidoglycan-N-acetylglucosamine deacetylase [Microgenomates group bacterium ADurb.Bin219]HNP89431.1 polysaccharide deacetylase family protein [Candidatus Woesebacteria bacterium]